MRFYIDTLEMVPTCRSDDPGWAQAAGEGQLAVERVDVSDVSNSSVRRGGSPGAAFWRTCAIPTATS